MSWLTFINILYFQVLQKEVIFIDLSHCTSLCTSAKGQKEAEIYFSPGLIRFGYPGFFGSFRLVAIQLISFLISFPSQRRVFFLSSIQSVISEFCIVKKDTFDNNHLCVSSNTSDNFLLWHYSENSSFSWQWHCWSCVTILVQGLR